MTDTNTDLIIHAASRIYAGMMASGNVNSSNHANASKYALASARKLVDQVDDTELSDEVPFPW